MLRTINQLNPLTSGELDFFDLGKIRNKKDLQNLRKKTGMIFQQHQLIERNTVFQNVLTGRLGFHSLFRSILPLPKFDQELALDCIDRVNLLDKALVKVKVTRCFFNSYSLFIILCSIKIYITKSYSYNLNFNSINNTDSFYFLFNCFFNEVF